MSIFQDNAAISSLYEQISKNYFDNLGWKDRPCSERWCGREDEVNLSKIPELELKSLTTEQIDELKQLCKDLKKEIITELSNSAESEMPEASATKWINKFNQIRNPTELLDWHNIFIEREDPKKSPGGVMKKEMESIKKETDWIEENIRTEKQDEVLSMYRSFTDRKIQQLFFLDLKRSKGKKLPQEVYRVWKAREGMKQEELVEERDQTSLTAILDKFEKIVRNSQFRDERYMLQDQKREQQEKKEEENKIQNIRVKQIIQKYPEWRRYYNQLVNEMSKKEGVSKELKDKVEKKFLATWDEKNPKVKTQPARPEFRGPVQPQQKEMAQPQAQPMQQEIGKHIVSPGESLSLIAKKYYGDIFAWPTIYDANKDIIKNPNHIQPGWQLKIPIRPQRKDEESRAKFLARKQEREKK